MWWIIVNGTLDFYPLLKPSLVNVTTICLLKRPKLDLSLIFLFHLSKICQLCLNISQIQPLVSTAVTIDQAIILFGVLGLLRNLLASTPAFYWICPLQKALVVLSKAKIRSSHSLTHNLRLEARSLLSWIHFTWILTCFTGNLGNIASVYQVSFFMYWACVPNLM